MPHPASTPPPAPHDDSPTLHFPRILCLHGGGTNTCIFRAQCRVLSSRLRHHFRLCYANAPFVSAEPGPDVLSVYREWGPWRRWILPEGHKGDNDNGQEEQGEREKDAIRKAITAAMDKDDESGADGEWVAVLGFSQGAKVAASVMMGQQLRHQRKRRERSGFRFAVLVAGRGPMIGEAGIDLDGGDSSDQRSHYVDSEGEGATKAHGYSDALLRLPTIHVHGRQDPGLELHCHFLEESFQRGSARLVEWDGGHRLPVKSKDVDVVVDAILGIARENGVL